MLRYLLTKRNLDSIQKANRERIEFYDYSSSDPYISGFIASEREWNLEKPDYRRDEQLSIVAMNSSSQLLRISLLKGPEVNGKVFVKILLTLKVTEKKVYSIEEQYLTPVSEMKKTEYRTGALSIEILSPFRRMRLHFRGILKNEETGETVFVHFRFHWYALSNVFDHKCSFNSNFIAQQLIDNKSKETKVENRFEQFGNIKGTLKFGKGKEEQIFLWGWRSKSFCKKELSASRLLLVAKNGIAISVGSVSNKKHQYKYSYGLVTNNKGIDGVTDITTKKNVIEKISLKAFEFQVSTGSNMYAVSVGRDNKKFIRDAVINQVEAKCVCFYDTFHITVNSSIMYNELSFAYQSEYTSKATNDLVIPLSDKHATSVQLSGGKGSSLAILSRMTSLSRITPRFQVPKGIVVTSNAFNSFLEKNNQVLRRIDLLEKLAWSKDESLKSECEKIQELISNQPIPSRVKSDIEKHLNDVFGTSLSKKYFAVRSSAVGEDSHEMSGAGQLITYLGVKGIDKILKAVMKCWGSQFNYKYTEYKRGYGQLINNSMAVVIQEMVNCDVAGVMFTCDPRNGDERTIVITANYGLGESVVSATSEPDTIRVKVGVKSNDLKVKRTVDGIDKLDIGEKAKCTKMNEKGGTIEVNVKRAERSECCISKGDITLLAKIGLNIQAYYGSTRDIEWGIKDDVIYILQSRPVTNLDSYSEWELMHDLDSGFEQEKGFYSRVHWSENFPGASSPLCISFTIKMLDYGFQPSSKNRNNFSPYSNRPLPTFYNQLCVNLRNFPISSNPKKNQNLAFPGQDIFDSEFATIVATPPKPGFFTRLRRCGSFVYAVIFVALWVWKLQRDLNNHEWFLNMDTQTAIQLFAEITNGVCQYFNSVAAVHGPVSMTAASFTAMILDILTSSTGNSEQALRDFAKIQEANNGIVSAEVPKLLKEIADAISDKKSFLKMSDEEALHQLLSGSTVASQKFTSFLDRHGYRGIKEMDPYVLQWRDAPIKLIPILKKATESSKVVTHETSKVQSVEELISSLVTKPSFFKRILLRILIPLSFRSTLLREKTKSLLVFFVSKYRTAFYSLANKLTVDEGRLPEQDLLFFLTLSEINQLINERNPTLVAKAKQRKRIHNTLDKLQFKPVIKDWEFSPLNVENQMYASKFVGAVKLEGTAITSLVGKGRAYVARSLEDAQDIQNGDILITYTTDIGWSPYFPLVSGVVTELGGLNSHGAVIAREFGLPCIVGVANACELFKTGDTILVDGERGLVTKLAEN